MTKLDKAIDKMRMGLLLLKLEINPDIASEINDRFENVLIECKIKEHDEIKLAFGAGMMRGGWGNTSEKLPGISEPLSLESYTKTVTHKTTPLIEEEHNSGKVRTKKGE